MPSYQLASEAADDLRSIAQYTLQTWGLEQTKLYEAQLSDCFEKIGQNQVIPRYPIPGRSDLLHTRCEHHHIFYALKPGQPPLILAIFHERMDLMSRLKNRLS